MSRILISRFRAKSCIFLPTGTISIVFSVSMEVMKLARALTILVLYPPHRPLLEETAMIHIVPFLAAVAGNDSSLACFIDSLRSL